MDDHQIAESLELLKIRVDALVTAYKENSRKLYNSMQTKSYFEDKKTEKLLIELGEILRSDNIKRNSGNRS